MAKENDGFLDSCARNGCGCVVVVIVAIGAGLFWVGSNAKRGAGGGGGGAISESVAERKREVEAKIQWVEQIGRDMARKENLERVQKPENQAIIKAMHAIPIVAVYQAERDAADYAVDVDDFMERWVDGSLDRIKTFREYIIRHTGLPVDELDWMHEFAVKENLLGTVPEYRSIGQILKDVPKDVNPNKRK